MVGKKVQIGWWLVEAGKRELSHMRPHLGMRNFLWT